jgi:hypothetical protein
MKNNGIEVLIHHLKYMVHCVDDYYLYNYDQYGLLWYLHKIQWSNKTNISHIFIFQILFENDYQIVIWKCFHWIIDGLHSVFVNIDHSYGVYYKS